MKRLYAPILLICCIVGNINAEDIDNGKFIYSISSDKKSVTIKKYSGPRNSKEVVVPKEIENIPVTQINRILGSDPSSVENVYIPANVTIKGSINNSQSTIKCGVIDEDLTSLADSYPFYYDRQDNNAKLLSIYTFGTKNYTYTELTGYENTYLFHLGFISVIYSDETTETIQMYNWGQDFPTRALVDQTRFEYLIWALEQHLVYKDYSLADIKEIDLTNLQNKPSANTEVNIDFGNYDPSSALNYGAKVIVSSNKEYEHTLKDNEIISITDLQDYTLPFIDTNTTIHYTRSNTKDWNSVCLPFVLHESDFPEDSNTKIYTISGADEERIKLTHVESVAAGEPCFICSKAENWNLSLTDREIKSTTQAGITEIEGWKMFGSFQEAEIGAGKFKLDSDGKSIGQTATNEARVYPFRCYLECTSTNGAPERFMVDIEGEEQSITFTEKDDETSDTIYLDLSGRRIQNTSEPRLIKGRNIIIR